MLKDYIRTAYWYTSFATSLACYYPKIRSFDKKRDEMGKEDFDEYNFRLLHKWASGLLKRSKTELINLGNTELPEGPVLIASNHQSNFDPMVLMVIINRPKGYVAKMSLSKIPILSRWMREMPSIFIDRENPKNAGKAILEGIKILKGGNSLVIYPEGTRGTNGNEIAEFKNGLFKMAQKAKVPIVPVTLCNTHKICEGNGNIIKPQKVYTYMHEPIDVVGMSKDELNELNEKVHAMMSDKMKELEKLN